jgi:hypothetical protein
MRIFSRSTEIEIEDLRIGRIRCVVRENVIDRLVGFFSPERLRRRLEARAALTGAAPRRGVTRGAASAGYTPPPREPSLSAWGPSRGDAFEQRIGWHQAGGVSRGEAIRRAVDDDPEGHRRWIESR